MEKVDFMEQGYALCQTVPRGKVTTYKELAKACTYLAELDTALGMLCALKLRNK